MALSSLRADKFDTKLLCVKIINPARAQDDVTKLWGVHGRIW